MNAKRLLMKLGLGTALVVGLILLIAWWPKGTDQAAAGSDTWTCSMHPQIRLPNPGPCPICGMQLIPTSKLPSERNDLETRAGIESEIVQRRALFKEIRTVGKLDYNERRVAYISARVAGRVDRIFADFTGMDVKKGDHLVDIYSPDLYSGQRELLIALDSHSKEGKQQNSQPDPTGSVSLLESARAKLLLWGLLPEQIKEIETTHKMRTHVTIYSPLGGVVVEKMVREGQYVKDGDPLYRIADLDPIWLYLDIYEFDVAWVRIGQAVDVQLEAFPGEKFNGSIVFIDPFLNDATRTIRVRVNIKNPDRLLKPQMFATATINVRLRSDGTPEPTGLEGMFVCPMHPEIFQREPGKCSICEMPLEKVPENRESKRKSDGAAHNLPHGNHGDSSKEQNHSAHVKESTAVAQEAKSKSHEEHTAKPISKKIAASGDGVLAIPVSAVLDTGRRRITYRQTEVGAYELVELKLGPRAHSMDESGKRREFIVVLDGVNEGDRVVSQSGFLLDSQRQIEGMPSLLYPNGQAGTALHSGHGGVGEAASKSEPKPAAGGHQH